LCTVVGMAGKKRYQDVAPIWAQEYRDGATVETIGLNHGIAYETIRRYLRDLGVTMRPPGEKPGQPNRKPRSGGGPTDLPTYTAYRSPGGKHLKGRRL
jgi:hypothetical protein